EPLLRFHTEHVVARQHSGADDRDNLALACPHSNLHKGTNVAGIDPESGTLHPPFNPRRDRWNDHFAGDGPTILGLSPTGRITADLLAFNADDRIELRSEIADETDELS